MNSELKKDLNILRQKYPKYYFTFRDKNKATEYQNKYNKINMSKIVERRKHKKTKKLYDCQICLKCQMTYNTMYKHLKSKHHLRTIRESEGIQFGL